MSEQPALPDRHRPDDPLLDAARSFGLDYLYPYQRLVISNVLEAAGALAAAPRLPAGTPVPGMDHIRRQIVVIPTGTGKSLCFQLPVRLLSGLTVVVYPLLSLMADQLRRASAAGLAAAVLLGGQTERERATLWEDVNAGRVRILLTNPETLIRRKAAARLADHGIAHLVIDEAHCVSEWGETFRPSYLELGGLIETVAPAATTAFTATASSFVLQAIRRHLFGDSGAHLIQSVPDRPNIAYSVLEAPAKLHALTRLLSQPH